MEKVIEHIVADKEIEILKNKIFWKIEDLTDNLPALARGVGDILGEASSIRETVRTLNVKYELIVEIYEKQIKELEEKIKTLEGGKENE